MGKRLILGTVLALLLTLAPSTAFAALVAEWRMDEPSGASIMSDSAAADGSNDGVISSVETGLPGLVSGSAYQFDGATSYVSVPDHDSLDPGAADIRITATVQVADGQILDDSYDIIRKGVTTTKGGNWKMEIKRIASDPTIGKMRCVFKGTTASGTRVAVQKAANRDVVDGSAHTLTCIKTATSVTAVVDGRSYSVTKAAGSIANDQPVILGSKVAGDDVLQGILDQVTVDVG